jgi:predicted nucleic acid-binding protein
VTSAFWDSSGFVKLLIEEPGRDVAVDAWNDSDRNIASRLAIPEVSAALAAARRSGRLDGRSDREARGRWAQHLHSVELVELAPIVSDRAAELVVEHVLSGADAVHLASALMLSDAEPVLLTWDRRLAAAAVAAGLSVAPGDF